MTFALLVAVQWMHVLGGIFWFGSALTLHFVVLPALKSMPYEAQRAWLVSFAARYGRVIGPIGGLTILFGITRGLVGGVWGSLSTPYGYTWVASIVLGIGLALIGGRLVGPAAHALAVAPESNSPALGARLARFGIAEIAGFLVLFTMMIAMRFGF